MRARFGSMVCLAVFLFSLPSWAGRKVIDTKEDWGKWTFIKGTVQVSDDGWVRPAYVHKDVNVAPKAFEFSGEELAKFKAGTVEAGSNARTAAHAIDGDLTTCWRPRGNDPVEDWWLEVDLGQLISATRMRLVFSEDGEPLRFFKIYASSGEPAFVDAKAPKYVLLRRTEGPNEQYIVEYDLSLDVIRYVRFVALSKSENMGLVEWEIYAVGENIGLDALERGGSVTAIRGGDHAPFVFDGDGLTFWSGTEWEAGAPVVDRWLLADLGASFWVDMIRIVGEPAPASLYSLAGRASPMIQYRLEASDGSKAPDGSLIWEEIGRFSNSEGQYNIEHYFPPRIIRYLRFIQPVWSGRFWTGTGNAPRNGRVNELQIFGEGHLPKAILTSDFIDLGLSRNITHIEWEGNIPSDGRLMIRTKAGNEVKEVTHYYSKGGEEISKEVWEGYPSFLQGAVKTESVPGRDWSAWSRAYLESGERFLSPSPRRYVQLQVTMLSGEPASAPSLDWIALVYADPVAGKLIGEVWPVRVEAGVPQRFSYFIRPSFRSGDQGFNRVLIRGVSRVDSMGVKVNGTSVDADFEVRSDSLWVSFPSRIRSSALVEIDFLSTIFLDTLLEGFAVDSRNLEAPQRIDEGDATDRVDSQTLMVSVSPKEELFGDVSIVPEVITPNGDGVNDEGVIRFTVFKLTRPRVIGVRIYELGGELVWELMDEVGLRGSYRVMWDGRGESGALVSPGVYVCQIKVKGDEKETVIHRTIAVVY